MERKRIGAVVAAVVIVIVVILAGWWIFLRSASPTPPEPDTVVLSVLTSTDLAADSYGNVPAAGCAFVAVGIRVSSDVGAPVTLRNGSFSIDANQTTFTGNLSSPGTLTLAPLAIADVSVYFELPISHVASRIRLSEGAARGSVAFVRHVMAGAVPVGLSVVAAAILHTDSWGNAPAAGSTFIAAYIHMASNLSAAFTLQNGSFAIEVNQTAFTGNLTGCGTFILPALAAGNVSVYFELPVGGVTSRIRLSEGAARGSVAFVQQLVPAGPRFLGTAVSSSTDGANWTVTFPFGPADLRPETTYLLVRNNVGNIILPKMSFGWLSWRVHGAVFVDASPTVSTLRPGDGLLISKVACPAESVIEISEDMGLLTSHVLR